MITITSSELISVDRLHKEIFITTKALSLRADAIVANISKANELLRACATPGDVKKVIDIAVTARILAERQKLGIETQNLASEIVLRAKRRLGELLNEIEKHKGGRPGNKPIDVNRQVYKLNDLGISRDLSSQAQRLAAVPEEEFTATIAEAKKEKKEIIQSQVLRKLTRKRPPDTKQRSVTELEDAVITDPNPTAVNDPAKVTKRICDFIDDQLLSIDDAARFTVAEALREHISKIIENKLIPKNDRTTQ